MSRATLCFSMYSLMSMRIMACSSSKRNSASARASSVLPTPVGPRKMNEPIGRFSSCKPARARRTALDTAVIAVLLADDALAEAVFHADEFFAFAFAQIGDGDAGPRADDFGDVFLGDFLLRSIGAPLRCISASLALCASSSRCAVGDVAVLDLAGLGRDRRGAARARARSQLLELLLQLALFVDDLLFVLPLGLEPGALFAFSRRARFSSVRGAPCSRRPSPFSRPAAPSRAA